MPRSRRTRGKFIDGSTYALFEAQRGGLHNFGFGVETNSTTCDVEVTHVVFVCLLDTGTLAQLEPSQSRSQEASVPECNSGGQSVLGVLDVARISSGVMSSGAMSSGAMSLSPIAFSSAAGSAVGAEGLRADSSRLPVGLDETSMRRSGRRAGPVW